MTRLVYFHGDKQVVKQGGISSEVWNNKEMQDYVHGPVVYGYVGDFNRTRQRDAIVEIALRRTGLKAGGIAMWLTSGRARHMMDSVDSKTSLKEFKMMVDKNTRNAFREVTVWSNPDHEGTLASTIEISGKIKKEFSG